MLHFLRIIRKDLIQVNNVKKYFLYAIGEILLIVVGILIAVQIGNWNQERRDRKEERVVLQAFGEELEHGLLELQDTLASLDHKDAALKANSHNYKGASD